MTRVTKASLAYVTTQVCAGVCYSHEVNTENHGSKVRFALSSSSVFSRSDTSTNSERFYNSVLDFLDDPEEQDEVVDLLNQWDWCVFPWIITNLVVIPT
jgi:hypothetical protein